MAYEAIRGVKTTNEIAQDYGVHPVQVGQWKKAITEQAGSLFEGKRGRKPAEASSDPERLYDEIGRLKMELDWLKKVRTQPVRERRGWIEAPSDESSTTLSLSRQCALAGVARSGVYRLERDPVQRGLSAAAIARTAPRLAVDRDQLAAGRLRHRPRPAHEALLERLRGQAEIT